MVVTDEFQVFLCDTVTGKIIGYVPVSQLSWGMRLNAPGTVSATLPVRAEEFRMLDLRLNAQVLSRSLGVVYRGTILECGPIWTQEYDADKETLRLQASGLWSILNGRKLLPGSVPGSALRPGSGAPDPAAARVTIRGSLRDIARELVRASIQDNPFTRPDGLNAGHLNIVLPEVEGGTNERNYQGYDLGWTGARLEELTKLQNGPDLRFRPRFNAEDATFVEWVMEGGTAANPLLTQDGPEWLWDAAVELSGIVGMSVSRDATTLAARSWISGDGQEAEKQIVWATDPTLTDYGFPWVEIDEAPHDVVGTEVLQGHADRLLAEASAPWDQWSLQVRADESPRLGDYLPGDWAAVNIGDGHPLILPGMYRVRILSIDGDESSDVKLTVAPMQARL